MTWIKKLYLYVVSLVSLIIVIIGATMLVNMGLKAAFGVDDYISYPAEFRCAQAPDQSQVKAPECDPAFAQKQEEYDRKNRANAKKRDAAQALAMIIVGAPVFYYHWRLARKEA